jgi:VWFA-related protein
MKLKTRTISLLLSVAASIFFVIVGCGGGGGSDIPFIPPNNPISSADLSLAKTVNNSLPDVDEEVVFTLTVTNAGPAVATGVIVTDQLPSGFTYVSDTSGGSYNPVTGVWSIGSVSAGGSLSMNITATVNPTGNYTNLAKVTAANDSTPNDNTAGVSAPPPSIDISINQVEPECSTKEINAFATVIDQNGDPVTTLTKSNFTVFENGTQIEDFEVQFVGTIPLSVAIVLDYSTSIFDSGVNTAMEDEAIEFINSLPDNSEAAIIKFGLTVQVLQTFTSVKADLIAAVRAPFGPERGTEIYQAILKGLEETANRPAVNRKAVVIFTDGKQFPDPSPSGVTIDDVIASANAKSIPIFPIGLGIDIDTDALSLLADETGGIFYQPITPDDLKDIYQQLANALIVNQFVFTYPSNLTGSVPIDLTIQVDENGLTDTATKTFTSCP